jgi:hypothetical protein
MKGPRHLRVGALSVTGVRWSGIGIRFKVRGREDGCGISGRVHSHPHPSREGGDSGVVSGMVLEARGRET